MSAEDEFTVELPLLFTGELGRSRLREVVAHLRGCVGCRADLVEAAAAHSALTATRRTLAASSGGPALGDRGDLGDLATMATVVPEPLSRLTTRRCLRCGRAQPGVRRAVGSWPAASRPPSCSGWVSEGPRSPATGRGVRMRVVRPLLAPRISSRSPRPPAARPCRGLRAWCR